MQLGLQGARVLGVTVAQRRVVRDAVDDLKDELNEAALSVQFDVLSLQSAKLGVLVRRQRLLRKHAK